MARSPHDKDLKNLESELRRNRPEPREGFFARMEAHVRADTPYRSSVPRFRVALAGAFLIVFLVPFAAFGGVGMTKTSIFGGAKGVGLSLTKQKSTATGAVINGKKIVINTNLARVNTGQKTIAKHTATTHVTVGQKTVITHRTVRKTKHSVVVRNTHTTVHATRSLGTVSTLQYSTATVFCANFSGTFVNLILPISPPSVGFWLTPSNSLGWDSITWGPCGFPLAPPAV